MKRGNLRPVVAYIWILRDDEPVDYKFADVPESISIPALDWWDGSIVEDENGRHIVVNPIFAKYREPDAEELACGHIKELKIFRKRKYYNRRRRCVICAMEAS